MSKYLELHKNMQDKAGEVFDNFSFPLVYMNSYLRRVLGRGFSNPHPAVTVSPPVVASSGVLDIERNIAFREAAKN